MIDPDLVFVLLAGIVILGFVLDSLFDRLRVTSVLPLMLIGIALVQFGVVPSYSLGVLNQFTPYISALTIAFILFSVGLELRANELYRVFGRATAYTLAVQAATGVAIALLAYATFRWDILLCFVFGFGLSGPSSVAVPLLVRVTKVGESLKTTLLYESVTSDVLQLLVPIILLGLYQTGVVSPSEITGSLLWQVLGSAGAGILAGIFWLWLLDYFRNISRGYTWTLTITLVLATYGLADLAGLSAAITTFVFGLVLGNALLLDVTRVDPDSGLLSTPLRFFHWVREFLRLRTRSLDISHIQQVQREVTFFASAFFFVYLGLLFQVSELTTLIVLVTIVAAVAMLGLRFVFLPLLEPYMDDDPDIAQTERAIVSYNISRGLAPAVIATIPASMGILIPGFLDAMFFGILFSNVISTIGIFWYFKPGNGDPKGVVAAPTPPL